MVLLRLSFLLKFVLLLGSVATGEKTIETVAELQNAAVGYELMQERLDYLQYRFVELFVYVKELGETVLNNQRTLEENQLRTNQLIHSHQAEVAANVSLMTTYAKQILELQTICANHDTILRELDLLKPNHTKTKLPAIHFRNLQKSIKTCNETNSKSSGVFQLLLPDSSASTAVFCDMESYGGGWLVFQQRVNGSVDFFRTWTEYRNGFGVIGEEFWAGLEMLHKLTYQGSYELLIELKDSSGTKKYARYSEFEIGSEKEKYSLKKLGSYSGTAVDSLTYHSGMKFSTFDSDNDPYSGNCAKDNAGAWWYKECYYSNLNGRFNAMCWDSSCSFKSKDTRMMIRLK